jgi:hypothetical protein
MATTTYPTYALQPSGLDRAAYPAAVATLADWVCARGAQIHGVVAAYGDFMAAARWERRRTPEEYLLEALMLGVLWRSRGATAAWAAQEQKELLRTLAEERRAGLPRRRDGSTAALLGLNRPRPVAPGELSLDGLHRLIDWLRASGEYDDEVDRLEGWQAFFGATSLDVPATFHALVDLADAFEAAGLALLGAFTSRVERFTGHVLPMRAIREDTMQCSRARVEYHFNMVGAELLNRAWRSEFLACSKHVVVLPGCARAHGDAACAARRTDHDLRCTHCAPGCTVSRASKLALARGGVAVAVRHGSDFGRFLLSPELAGGNVGLVGVACVSGLVGAGWRARALGLPAQCVLLESSGCAHWRDRPEPTALDLVELARVLPGSVRRHLAAERPGEGLTERAA